MKIIRSEKTRLSEVSWEKLKFGQCLSDHMAHISYRDGAWSTLEIKPYAPISLSPAFKGLHYGQSIFEGLKAYRINESFASQEQKVSIFRLKDHWNRFNQSASRMCMPEISFDLWQKSIIELVKMDMNWIPHTEGASLYIRPIMFAVDSSLGLSPSLAYDYYVLLSPVGQYYKDPWKNKLSLVTSGGYHRTVKGGIGESKTSGNYGASLYPALQAQQKGYDQILWLNAKQEGMIDEVGTMNIFFVFKGKKVITPALNGCVLKGITRDSCLFLLKKEGYHVEEKDIFIEDLFNQEEELVEIFGVGTAAMISPVGSITHQDRTLHCSDRGCSVFLYERLSQIQRGEYKEDSISDWLTFITKNDNKIPYSDQ